MPMSVDDNDLRAIAVRVAKERARAWKREAAASSGEPEDKASTLDLSSDTIQVREHCTGMVDHQRQIRKFDLRNAKRVELFTELRKTTEKLRSGII